LPEILSSSTVVLCGFLSLHNWIPQQWAVSNMTALYCKVI